MECPNCKRKMYKVNVSSTCDQVCHVDDDGTISERGPIILDDTLIIRCVLCDNDITGYINEEDD